MKNRQSPDNFQTLRDLQSNKLTPEPASRIDLLRHSLGDDITLKALTVVYRRYKLLTSGELNCRKCGATLTLENSSFERWAVRRESICRSCDQKKSTMKGESQIPRPPDGLKCQCGPCRKIKNPTTPFDVDVEFDKGSGIKVIRYLCASCNRSKQGSNHCQIHNYFFGN